ncbi:MAG TPA: hypothetical protein VES02_08815 [Dermatophilaceae bacterium]|nr:hypothetical protein [Dermatophilaceae bacterium]
MTASLEIRAMASATESLGRLAACSSGYLGTAGWWARLADALDDLRDQIARADMPGLAAQLVADAPELASSAMRLPELDDQAQADAALLRLEVADKAGLRSEARSIREALRVLLDRVRRIERISDDLLHDTYQRDFGGG